MTYNVLRVSCHVTCQECHDMSHVSRVSGDIARCQYQTAGDSGDQGKCDPSLGWISSSSFSREHERIKFSPSRNMQIPPSNEWVAQTIALRSSKRLSCSPRSSKCLAAEQFSVLSLVLLKMQSFWHFMKWLHFSSFAIIKWVGGWLQPPVIIWASCLWQWSRVLRCCLSGCYHRIKANKLFFLHPALKMSKINSPSKIFSRGPFLCVTLYMQTITILEPFCVVSLRWW